MALALLSGANVHAQLTRGDITRPGDLIVGTSVNVPAGQEVDKVIDNNPGTKYLNFDKLNTGFTVTPSIGLSVVSGMNLVSGGDAPERDPSSFTLEGSLDGGTTWSLIASNALPAFTARLQVRSIDFPNTKAYTSYRLIFPTLANAAAANSMQITEVELLGNVFSLGALQSDITCPLDAVTAITSNNPTPTDSTHIPAAQLAGNAIDNVVSGNSKYLNFDKFQTGLIITPSKGNSRVNAVGLVSGGDSPERDPSSYSLEGSNDGGTTWTLITSNAVPTFFARLQRQVFYFANNNDYTSYRLVFPTIVNNAGLTANSMQITEIELMGVAYTPGIASVAQAPGNRTVLVGEPATFSVTAAGTPAYTYQWFSNGVAIAGATSSIYKTRNTTLADNSTSYWVAVSNALGGTVSSTAVLSVVSPSGTPGSYVASFTGGVMPAGAYTLGSAAVTPQGGVGGSNGVLVLTTGGNGLSGQFYVNDLAAGTPVNSFKLSARVAIGGGTARPADGMAFSFGSDLANNQFGEEGAGSGIIVGLDTWDNNGDDTAPAIDVKVGGAVIAFKALMTNYNNTGTSFTPLREGGRAPAGPILTDINCTPVSLFTFGQNGTAPNDGSFVPLTIELFPDNSLSVTWSNVVIFDHVALPYTPIANGQFAFGARTGGANAAHMIDDLQIYVNYTPGAATIVTPPSNVVTNEGSKAVFSVVAGGSPAYNIQWY
ncbi:MAG: hypothetical protein JWM16_5510, partial [Verrucomicrobiales bacterium]|nr:hypothetical protein [Verrucomicrobiales bacterium]